MIIIIIILVFIGWQVIAEDVESGSSSSTSITIELTDVNDHAPKFNQSLYNVSVLETTPANTKVVAVKVCLHIASRSQLLRCGFMCNKIK